MTLIYNATFDKNTRKLSFEDKAGNEIYSFIVPERTPAVDDITKPLTLKATQDGSTVELTNMGSPSGRFQTSRDGGNTWSDYTINTAIALNTGDEVSFRAKSDRTLAQSDMVVFYFRMTGKIEAWHNVMSLYRTNDFATYESVVEYAFDHLFYNCTSLTKAPALPATTLANFCYSHMFFGCRSLTKAPELPATTLANNCYWYMFSRCQSLTKAPELPETTLAANCYEGMFKNCQSLTNAPELPVTTLAPSCYAHMFFDCQSLTKAPALPATTLADNCYKGMFSGCQSLTNAPELPATTLAAHCYEKMFSGCRSLNEVHCQMPSTVSAESVPNYTGSGENAWLSNVSSTGTFYTNADANWSSGASGIPEGWNRVAVDDITKPLTFKATQDGSTVSLKKNGSPTGVFQTSRDGGNTWEDYSIGTSIALNTGEEVSFRAKADRTSAQNGSKYFQFNMTGKIEAWHNVMSLYRTSDFATYESVMNHAFFQLFKDCTSLTKAPRLPATTLAQSCYDGMFRGCQSLTNAPALPATTLANGCYWSMFSGCQSLKEAPSLPATTLDINCYQGMFSKCQSLTKAPALPATTLIANCYQGMFSKCQSLKEVRISATTTATDALYNWLNGVSATGDFYCDPNATIFPSGASGIPANWSRHALADYPVTP